MTEFKVGLLALATMISVVFMSFRITSNQSGFGEYVTYRTVVSDASGIFPKTPIRVAGINAGRIKNIELEGNHALITFEVLDKVNITQGSRMKIKTVGFLGDKYLEIQINPDVPDRLSENSLIVSELGGGMEDIVKDASEVVKDIKSVVKGLKRSFAPDGKDSPFKIVIDDIQALAKNTRSATETLKRIMDNNESKVNNMIGNMESASERLDMHLDATRRESLMADLKRIGPIMEDLKRASQDVEEMIADIKSGKGTLGKLIVDEQISDEVRQTLAGVNRMVGRVNAIQTQLGVFTGVNSLSGGETEVELRILPSPERFYLLGVTTSKVGPQRSRQVTTTINGVETVEVRREIEQDTYRLNIQIGRKIHNWSIRGGLVESSGGFGVDYDQQSWGTRFTFEIFDYRDDIGPNVRFIVQQHLWNVFYGRASFEELIFSNQEFNTTISAGLRFNDEDLKALVGYFL